MVKTKTDHRLLLVIASLGGGYMKLYHVIHLIDFFLIFLIAGFHGKRYGFHRLNSISLLILQMSLEGDLTCLSCGS